MREYYWGGGGGGGGELGGSFLLAQLGIGDASVMCQCTPQVI